MQMLRYPYALLYLAFALTMLILLFHEASILGMRMVFYLLIFIIFGGLTSITTAQSQSPYPPDDVIMIYYEDEHPNGLDNYLLGLNICLEALLRFNPTLDINNVPYGTKLYLPRKEGCYQYSENHYYGWWGKGNPARLKFYENGQWLDEPYYSEDIFYISGWQINRTRGEFSLQAIADYFKVCLDDLLAENYLLAHHFEAYTSFYKHSMDIFVPRYLPPCHPYVKPEEKPQPESSPPLQENVRMLTGLGTLFSPLYFSRPTGFCVEEVMNSALSSAFYHDYSRRNNTISVKIPNDAPPCYNEQGQRLKYYDDDGNRLETPFYSDLPVYLVRAGQTIVDVAQRTGACVGDIMRINGYPSLPALVEIELFLPPVTGMCDAIWMVRVNSSQLKEISLITNTCPEILLTLNPFLDPQNTLKRTFYGNNSWILVTDAPCYEEFIPNRGESAYDIEKMINICFEEFTFVKDERNGRRIIGFNTIVPANDLTLLFPKTALPCYNDLGQRLFYTYVERYTYNYVHVVDFDMPPYYTPMRVYNVQKGDTIYSISKRFNVCVRELIAVNNFLRLPRLSLQEKRPVFIPETRPCYDEATGTTLIYDDADGNPLPEPQVGEHLIHYGAWDRNHMSYIYNVCVNRISDANRNKYDERGNATYLGYIIPTDRPPCYDENGRYIEYVCYDQPIDFDVDYRNTDPPLSFNVHGTHCYNIHDFNTVVWYLGKPYKVLIHREGHYQHMTMFSSRAFTAWCFGVSLDEMNTINADADFLPILPYHTRAIPLPTRECYLKNPAILANHETIHMVQRGDTLRSISLKYGVPQQAIRRANDIDGDMIWIGQRLIIPPILETEMVYWLVALGMLCFVIPFYGKKLLKK